MEAVEEEDALEDVAAAPADGAEAAAVEAPLTGAAGENVGAAPGVAAGEAEGGAGKLPSRSGSAVDSDDEGGLSDSDDDSQPGAERADSGDMWGPIPNRSQTSSRQNSRWGTKETVLSPAKSASRVQGKASPAERENPTLNLAGLKANSSDADPDDEEGSESVVRASRALQKTWGRRLSVSASSEIELFSLDHTPWADMSWNHKFAATAKHDSHRPGSVVIFDWDDTLLPTTAVAGERGWEGHPPPEEVEALTEHAKVVSQLLEEARSVARVAIVTLAKRPWVQFTAERYLLGVDWARLFKELDIVVEYAQEVLSHKQRQYVSREPGVNFWVASKTAAMAKALRKLKLGREDIESLNVVSIGDSAAEREAARELVWRRPCQRGEDCYVKTVMLRDEPSSVGELTGELRELQPWLETLVAHDGDHHFELQDVGTADSPLRRSLEQAMPVMSPRGRAPMSGEFGALPAGE